MRTISQSKDIKHHSNYAPTLWRTLLRYPVYHTLFLFHPFPDLQHLFLPQVGHSRRVLNRRVVSLQNRAEHTHLQFGIRMDRLFSVHSHRSNKILVLFLNIDKPQIHQCLFSSYTLRFRTQQTTHEQTSLTTEASLHLRRKNKGTPHYIVYRVRMVLRLERSHPSQQLIHSYAQSPHIHQLVIPPSLKHLRRPVVRRPCQSQHLPLDSPSNQLFADSKVNQNDPLLLFIVEDVLGLNIPMANLVRVNVDESLDDLKHQLFYFLRFTQSTCSVFKVRFSRSG